MTHRGERRRWAGARLLLSVIVCLPGTGRAADALRPQPNEDSEWVSGHDSNATPAYVDRVIDGLTPLPIDSDEGSGGPATGRPRSLTVESSITHLSPSSRGALASGGFAERKTTEAGVAFDGRYDTGNYGTLGIGGTLRYGTFATGFGGITDGGGGDRSRPVVGGTLTLSDSGLPVGHGWALDSAVGVVEPRSILLAHAQSRFYLPSQPLLGAQVVLAEAAHQGRADAAGTSFNFALGEPGLPGGLRVAQFRGLGGLQVTGGSEFRPALGFALGVQAIGARNVRDPYGVLSNDLVGAGRLDGESVLVAASAGGSDWRIQLNLQHSSTRRLGPARADQPGLPVDVFPGFGSANAGPGNASGGWADAVLDHGRVSQSAGLFYLDPRLAWGATPMINDSYGGYYRINVTGALWRWFAGVDVSRTISGTGLDSEYFDAGVRRQFTGVAVGGVASLRIIGAGRDALTLGTADTVGAKQLTGYTEVESPLGLTRVEAGYGFDRVARLAHVGVSQTWTLPSWLPASSRLSTQLFYDDQRDRTAVLPDGSANSHGFGVAVTAGGDVFAKVGFDASVAYGGTSNGTAGIGAGGIATGGLAGYGASYSQRGENFSTTLAVNARLSSRWTLTGSFTDAETFASQAFGGFGASSAVLFANDAGLRQRYRLLSAAFAVRYSFAAGRVSAPLGTASFGGGGTGSVSGHLFLDANGNGRRDPGETGVGDAVVILDGRAGARTDAAGYYRFDDVAEGRHRITVPTDALPLPWHYSRSDGQANAPFDDEVVVSVRTSTLLDIRAIR